MAIYLNRSGNSPITHYEIGSSYITVKFHGATRNYMYSYNGKAGKIHVENMKILAVNGSGLSAYITQHVRKDYD